jgi:hypothetical protein
MTTDFANDLHDAVPSDAQLSSPTPKKWERLRQMLANELSLSPDAIFAKTVDKIGSFENRLGETFGRESAVERRLGVVVVQNESDLAGMVQRSRTYVGIGRQVRAMLFLVRRDGRWSPAHLMEPQDDGIEASLTRALGASNGLLVEHLFSGRRLTDVQVRTLAEGLFVAEAWLREVLWLLEDRKALVFYGPPGTGKTYIAQAIAAAMQPDSSLRTLVQLHPSYGYEEFFEGYRPTPAAAGLSLQKRPGPLRELTRRAAQRPDHAAVLILDEMNRANLPKVFGELYFLLEYRDRSVSLMYSPDEAFSLPENLYLVGCMNTADRSIALLDQALRRRFHFVGLFPGEQPVSDMLRRFLGQHAPGMAWLADVLDEANRRLGDRNVAIGPSHFMRRGLDEDSARRIWHHSILPTIEEHFFGQGDRVREFSLDVLRAFVTRTGT